jgi:hypothetical protein
MNQTHSHPLVILASLLLTALCSFAVAEEEIIQRFDFETGVDGWRPRLATVRVTHVQGPGAVADNHGQLRISGSIATGWNYAVSQHVPIESGRLYRLTARLRTDRLGSDTPSPYLKCEFIAADSRSTAGQVHTDRYDRERLGTWQTLQVEFQAPENAAACWLALEKGTDGPAEIDAVLDDITLERIARLSVLDQYRVAPLPEPLERVRGRHPRLYLDAQRVAELRQAVQTTHAELWDELRGRADQAVRRGPPQYREQDGYSGDEQLWQREVGNAMPVLAMAYVISGQRQYLESARDWALASCGYRTWGLGRIDGLDLAAGHQLFGLAIVYDWCYQDLDPAARQTIRETIARRGGVMFEAGATGKAWWRQSYLQNHLWVNACGLAMAGLAVFDEVEDADLWIGFALDKFRRSVAALGPDGASHEGVGYWEYGVEYLLKFMSVARELLGVDLYQYPWWRNTARYALYLSLPRDAWTVRNCIVDIADCPRGHWYGPDYLLRGLAAEYGDSQAQWLAQEADRADVCSSGAPWLNLIWYDPAVPAESPGTLPTLHHFDDMDIVSARSGWSGDESLVVLKCGPFLGHEAVQQFSYDPGGGHVHPDANHFVLFAAGQWLVRDDGYRAKWTGQHNTLLIDGRGQLGEGKQWFQGAQPLAVKARPRVLRAASSPELDHIVSDAARAYPSDLGLQQFQRHLLFVKPDVLIVVDDIQLQKPRELELRFHPEQQRAERDGDAFVFPSQTAVLQLEPLTGEASRVEAAATGVAGRHGEADESLMTVRLTRTTADWRNAVALSWARNPAPPVDVELEQGDHQWVFRCGSQTVTLDWDTGHAAVRATESQDGSGAHTANK